MNRVSQDPSYSPLKHELIASTGLAFYQDRDGLLTELIDGRLSDLGLRDCSSYAQLLADGQRGSQEMERLIAKLTIGETYFFRDQEQFAALRDVILPGSRRHAVWVDEFLTERDALIQELGMPCPATGNISGGALLREGTVFIVLNPAGLAASCTLSAAIPAPRKAEAPAQAIATSILVVDDSITSRSLERSILEAHGYRVRVAVDGLEALELLRIEKADLIITDVQMPRMDGFGLVEALKADTRLKEIPVIIVSSLESPEDQERGLLLGADAYVVKRKFDQTELLDAIQQMI